MAFALFILLSAVLTAGLTVAVFMRGTITFMTDEYFDDRIRWAEEKYAEYCASHGLAYSLVGNGGMMAGRAWRCGDATGYVDRLISGHCHVPTLRITDRRSGRTRAFFLPSVSMTHPSCEF